MFEFFIFPGTAKTKSLSHIRPVIKAADGVAGRNTHRHGKNADHLYVEVTVFFYILHMALI